MEEIRGYQNRDDILDVEFRACAIVRHDCLTFLIGIFLFEVFHKPLEYLDIAVNTYIYVIHARRLSQVFLEVFHVCDEELLLTGEILVYLAVLIEDVDHDDLLLLLTVATGLLEAVMNPGGSPDPGPPAPGMAATTTSSEVVRRGGPTRAHASPCLLLL